MRRRTFLKFTLGGSLVSFLSVRRRALAAGLSALSVDGAKQAIVNRIKQAVLSPRKPAGIKLDSHTVEVLRAEDMLNLRFEFENLTLDLAGAKLLRIDKNKTAYVRVVFPPQHIGEEAIKEKAKIPNRPMKTHIAGESRLVFRVPGSVNEIPYDLDTILSWQQWAPSLARNALPPEFESTASLSQDVIMANRQAALNSSVGGYSMKLPQLPGHAQGGAAGYRVMMPGEYNAYGNLMQARAPKKKKTIKVIAAVIGEGPGPNITAIEAPTRLILSPHRLSAWAHVTHPVSKKSAEAKIPVRRTELWHTRLGVSGAPGADGKPTVDEDNPFLRTVRAIWATDKNAKAKDQQCGSSSRTEPLTAGERYQIVQLSSNLKLKNERPVQANHLILSALGSWLDLRGDWSQPPGSGFDLESWTHRATMGRDQFVRVVCKGYLFPFGHRAALITITERRPEEKPRHAAYLRFYQFVVVREPEKQYAKEPTSTGRDAVEGRQIPFKTVRLKTLVTPHLNPMPDQVHGWLQVDKQDFQFKIEAEDWDGHRCEFTAPLNFVSAGMAEKTGGISFFHFSSDSLGSRINSYNTGGSKLFQSRRERTMAGQKLAFAPSMKPGDTSFETHQLVFGARFRDKPKVGELLFYPVIQTASVRLAAASHLTGNDTQVRFLLYPGFVDYGFGKGKLAHESNTMGEVFAAVTDAVALQFPNHQAGGLASPNMAIRGLSRKLGILGGTIKNQVPFKGDVDAIKKNDWYKDLHALATGNISLASVEQQGQETVMAYFKNFFHQAKLLGAIELGDIVTQDFGGGKNIPQFKSVPEYDAAGSLKAIQTSFVWAPSVKDIGPFKAQRYDENGIKTDATFSINTVTDFPLDGSKAHTTTTGSLRNFSIVLLPGQNLTFVELSFSEVRFVSKDGQKPDFSASGTIIRFLGDLQFVNKLEKFLHGNNFSDPPSLNIGQDGIQLGYSLAIPKVEAGSFALMNLSLSAGLLLPFTGAPLSLNFAVSTRDNPFTISYLIFGGGGFFGITVGTDGLHVVEASLEFGGNCALDIGVASGKAYLMVGIYFNISKDDKSGSKKPTLAGYVRAGAALEVLGLIGVSVQFRFQLTYDSGSGSASGTGTLTVEVDVAFFSKSVDLTISKQFAGSPHKTPPPNTGQIDSPTRYAWLESGDGGEMERWSDDYYRAFAGEAA